MTPAVLKTVTSRSWVRPPPSATQSPLIYIIENGYKSPEPIFAGIFDGSRFSVPVQRDEAGNVGQILQGPAAMSLSNP